MEIVVVGTAGEASELLRNVAAARGHAVRVVEDPERLIAAVSGPPRERALVWVCGDGRRATDDAARRLSEVGLEAAAHRILVVAPEGGGAAAEAVAAGAADDLLIWPCRVEDAEARLVVAERRLAATPAAHGELERLRTVRSIDAAVLEARTPEAAAIAALDGLRTALGFEHGRVQTVDFESQQATVLAECGPDGLGPPAADAAAGTLELGFELLQGHPLIVDDLASREPEGALETELRDRGCVAYGHLPLVARSALVGTALVGFRRRPIPESAVEVLGDVARSLAVALHDTRLLREVERLADTDALTGLTTRRRLFDLGERELQRSRRYRRPLAAMMLDLDRFKRVNDRWGHRVGDAVLVEVAERCRASLRDVDLVGRYGGEEIAALLPETDLEGAREAAERIRLRVGASPIRAPGAEVAITVSIGVTVANATDGELAVLLGRADGALYDAKKAGRDRVVVIDPR